MAVNRYLGLNGGSLTMVIPATSSAGASSAGQLVALNSSGQIDSTMLPSSSGGTTITWTQYATGFSVIPTVNSTISSGTVYNYTYNLAAGGTVTYYRLVPSSSSYVDSFYSTFSGGVLSGLLASKQLSF